jgi:hypothetical protein
MVATQASVNSSKRFSFSTFLLTFPQAYVDAPLFAAQKGSSGCIRSPDGCHRRGTLRGLALRQTASAKTGHYVLHYRALDIIPTVAVFTARREVRAVYLGLEAESCVLFCPTSLLQR